jgi:hypothetical protein
MLETDTFILRTDNTIKSIEMLKKMYKTTKIVNIYVESEGREE